MLLALLAACDTQPTPEAAPLPLQEAHRTVLACAGWLAYVELHVQSLSYVDSNTFAAQEQNVAGSASCQTGQITVATGERNAFKIARILVHEAAHLADGCQNGEQPAVRAEIGFQEDFASQNCPIPF